MTTTELPGVVAEYFRASALHDADSVVATFADDATVTDEGHTHTGHAEIAAWRRQTSSEFSYTTDVSDVMMTDADKWTITARVAGDFPGSLVDLHFAFTLRDGVIAALTIAP